ncbi:dTMP kinase [Simkania negevensis]|uniref:Thymidylate kinase n=1 Tax=Simkania negevensis TaxID=83561 RepID=A0ABS3AVY7_9BACT|nr:dTMP kinase [Simkania negevensis]
MEQKRSKKSHSGVFITFEGGEGAGKSSVVQQLCSHFQSRQTSVVITREPGGTPFGDLVRHWLLAKEENIALGDWPELLLFLASRVQHIDQIILPALKQGKVVLCDRFNDSSIAYQGGGRSMGVDAVQELCMKVAGRIKPDVTILFDLDPIEGLARSKKVEKKESGNDGFDRLESETIAFHQRVRQTYLTLARKEPERIHVVDASQPLEVVYSDVLKIIDRQLTC